LTQVSADFETGVNGATIATTDTGSATAFDAVSTTPTNGVAVYDTTHVAFGSLAAKLGANASGAANAYVTWSTALGTVTDHFGRLYLYLTAYGSGNIPIIWAGQGTTRGCRVDFTSTGKLAGFDNAGAALFTTFTNAIPLNQLVRIEWHFVCSATVGQGEVKLFNTASSTTPTETQTGTATKNTLANHTAVKIGVGPNGEGSLTANGVLWMDNIIAGATSYPGPFVPASSSSPGADPSKTAAFVTLAL